MGTKILVGLMVILAFVGGIVATIIANSYLSQLPPPAPIQPPPVIADYPLDSMYTLQANIRTHKVNLLNTHRQMDELVSIYGPRVGDWPLQARSAYERLSRDLANEETAYDQDCTTEETAWQIKFSSSPAPKELAPKCYLIPYSSQTETDNAIKARSQRVPSDAKAAADLQIKNALIAKAQLKAVSPSNTNSFANPAPDDLQTLVSQIREKRKTMMQSEYKLIDLMSAYGKSVNSWPSNAREVYDQLNNEISSVQGDHNSLCDTYDAGWKIKFAGAVAPLDLPYKCYLIDFSPTLEALAKSNGQSITSRCPTSQAQASILIGGYPDYWTQKSWGWEYNSSSNSTFIAPSFGRLENSTNGQIQPGTKTTLTSLWFVCG